MARFSVKNMTPAELKALRKDLGASLKALEGSVKLAGKDAAAAAKACESIITDAGKALSGAQKAYEAAVKAANKNLEAFKKNAEKEGTKLQVQIDAHKAKLTQIDEALAPKELAPAAT
jgi:hypothetical protein